MNTTISIEACCALSVFSVFAAVSRVIPSPAAAGRGTSHALNRFRARQGIYVKITCALFGVTQCGRGLSAPIKNAVYAPRDDARLGYAALLSATLNTYRAQPCASNLVTLITLVTSLAFLSI